MNEPTKEAVKAALDLADAVVEPFNAPKWNDAASILRTGQKQLCPYSETAAIILAAAYRELAEAARELKRRTDDYGDQGFADSPEVSPELEAARDNLSRLLGSTPNNVRVGRALNA